MDNGQTKIEKWRKDICTICLEEILEEYEWNGNQNDNDAYTD